MLKPYAIGYAKRGWAVFPCKGKIPLTKNGFKGAKSDPQEVEDLFKAHPNCNIGLVTGKDSGFFVIDIDVKNEAGGEDSLSDLEAKYGQLPPTVICLTPTGGRHIFFRYPKNVKIGCKTAIAPGIDIRGDGGYVIAAPSVLDGKEYVWEAGHSPDEIEFADAPQWAIDLLISKPTVIVDHKDSFIIKSRRNATLTSYAGRLRALNFDSEQLLSALRIKNDNECRPPLPDHELVAIANSISKYSVPDAKDRVKFDPNTVADSIMADHKLIHCNNQYYKYNCSVYKEFDIEDLRLLIKRKLGQLNNQFRSSEVVFSLRSEINVNIKDLNSANMLNVKNGMLDVDLMQLFPHDPKYNSTIQLPVDYDPMATCPKWIKFLDEIFTDKTNEETQRSVGIIQEFFGLCLTKEVKYEKALFLLGEGQNGKSTLLYILEQVLGENNFSGITLESLSNLNYVSEICGKLANISIEVAARTSVYDAMFKSIISGDTITSDRKYGHPFKFKPFCKMIFALNNMPQVNDKTDAFFRRLIILRLNRQFEEKDQDKELKTKLITELPGIFNWMVQGYQRLKARKYFDVAGHVAEEIKSYRQENNSVLGFVSEECEITDGKHVLKSDFYNQYRSWCASNGIRSLSKLKVSIQLHKHLHLEVNHRDPDGERIWRNIHIKHQIPAKFLQNWRNEEENAQ